VIKILYPALNVPAPSSSATATSLLNQEIDDDTKREIENNLMHGKGTLTLRQLRILIMSPLNKRAISRSECERIINRIMIAKNLEEETNITDYHDDIQVKWGKNALLIREETERVEDSPSKD
jgi:hypothetical protein